MTATHADGVPEGVAQDVEAPAAEQARVGPLTGDPAIVGVPTFVVGPVMLGLALPPARPSGAHLTPGRGPRERPTSGARAVPVC
jgi:hypothetical protein